MVRMAVSEENCPGSQAAGLNLSLYVIRAVTGVDDDGFSGVIRHEIAVHLQFAQNKSIDLHQLHILLLSRHSANAVEICDIVRVQSPGTSVAIERFQSKSFAGVGVTQKRVIDRIARL